LVVTGPSEPAGRSCQGYRFPAKIISYETWLYQLLSLSPRNVGLSLGKRAILIDCESIRCWCQKFGADFARKLRRRRPKPCGTWHR